MRLLFRKWPPPVDGGARDGECCLDGVVDPLWWCSGMMVLGLVDLDIL